MIVHGVVRHIERRTRADARHLAARPAASKRPVVRLLTGLLTGDAHTRDEVREKCAAHRAERVQACALRDI